jgi:hypothetical protein
MPKPSSVQKLFLADLKVEDGHWENFDALVDTYGVGLFYENLEIFHLAIEHKRSDFISKYKNQLEAVLQYIGDWNEQSLLAYAIQENDMTAVRLLTHAWIKILNRNCDQNILLQRLYHPSYFLRTRDLVSLANEHPTEFSKLICQLNLVKAHSSVMTDCEFLKIEGEDRQYIQGCDSKAADRFWRDTLFPANGYNQTYDSQDRDALPVTATFIPLMHACDFDILRAIITTSENLGNVAIFESTLGNYILKFIWNEYGQHAHIKTTRQFLVYLSLFTINVFSFEALIDNHDAAPLAWIIQTVTLLGMFYLMYQEYLQLKSEGPTITWTLFREHFTNDFWNAVDITMFLSGIIGIFIRYCAGEETDASRIVLALASVVTWFKVLYFMRVSYLFYMPDLY